MSERQYFQSANGQEVQQDDINLLGESGALADDRVLWELLRMTEGVSTPRKLVLPFARLDASKITGLTSAAMIQGGTADAKIRLMPFRAVLGSRTLIGTSPIEHLRGIRSGYAIGTSNLWREHTIVANASGNPRWDLVYATITPDVSSSSVTRYNKNPSGGAVTPTVVPVYKSTTVTTTVLAGTPGASPARPAVPADGGGSFHIKLAYVWVPNGFGAASTVDRGQIYEIAPVGSVVPAAGTMRRAVATSAFAENGAVDTNQVHAGTTRPSGYLPPTMSGGDEIIIPIVRGLTPHSHEDGDVIDNSRDWRYRLFWWQATLRSGTTAAHRFPFDRALSGASAFSAFFATAGQYSVVGHGQSYFDDSASGIAVASCAGVAVFMNGTTSAELNASEVCQISVRASDGALIYKRSGSGATQMLIKLSASAPYENFGTK